MTEIETLPMESATPIDPLLKKISSWVADRTPVDTHTRAALTLVHESNNAKLRLYRQVLALKKTQRLTRLHGFVDDLEGRLFDQEVLDKIKDPKTLVLMGRLLVDLVKTDSEYIEKVVDEAGTDPAVASLLHQMQVDAEQEDAVEDIRQISPQRREGIRQLFEKIARSVRDEGDDAGRRTTAETDSSAA